jgi:hypothetical protein
VEIAFYEGLQHRLRFCLDHFNCVKTAVYQFYLQSVKQRKVAWDQVKQVGWVGEDSHVAFGKKFSGEKGNVRRCVVVMQQPVPLSPKFGAKFSHIFTQSPLNVRVVCGSDCLACQDEFSIPLTSKMMMRMYLTLFFTSLAFFDVGEFGPSLYGSCFLPRKLV